MLLATGGAAREMLAHPGDGGVRILSEELKVDVAVDLLEAFVAAELGSRRPEKALDQLGGLGACHGLVSIGRPERECPSSARCLRSLRRASCRVL